jgi:hypothetical protein
MVGRELRISTPSKKYQKRLDQFCTSVDTRGHTIEDLFMDTWTDNIIHADSFFRPWKTSEVKSGTDFSRVDPIQMREYKHPETGYTLFLQTGNTWSDDTLRTKTYKKFFKNFPITGIVLANKRVIVKIPNKIDKIVRFKYFKRPPMGPLVTLVVYKKWILWYMKKHSQKYWAPYTVAYLGDKDYMPAAWEMNKYGAKLRTELPKMYNFSGNVLPGWIRLEQLQSTSKGDAVIYPSYIELLDKQILNGLFGSMTQREGNTASGITKREVNRSWLMFCWYIRSQFERIIKPFLAEVLCDGGVEVEEITFEWSPLVVDSPIDVASAVERFSASGILDSKELRRIANTAHYFIDPNKKVTPHKMPDEKMAEKQLASQEKMGEKQIESGEKIAKEQAKAAKLSRSTNSSGNKPAGGQKKTTKGGQPKPVRKSS